MTRWSWGSLKTPSKKITLALPKTGHGSDCTYLVTKELARSRKELAEWSAKHLVNNLPLIIKATGPRSGLQPRIPNAAAWRV
jgi:hypothetical protein